MSFTRRDWEMISDTFRETKPQDLKGFPPLRQQWEKDVKAIAEMLKRTADQQEQEFCVPRFLKDCGLR